MSLSLTVFYTRRTWNAVRLFPGMRGELEVLERLPPAQVEQCLSRIAAAPR